MEAKQGPSFDLAQIKQRVASLAEERFSKGYNPKVLEAVSEHFSEEIKVRPINNEAAIFVWGYNCFLREMRKLGYRTPDEPTINNVDPNGEHAFLRSVILKFQDQLSLAMHNKSVHRLKNHLQSREGIPTTVKSLKDIDGEWYDMISWWRKRNGSLEGLEKYLGYKFSKSTGKKTRISEESYGLGSGSMGGGKRPTMDEQERKLK